MDIVVKVLALYFLVALKPSQGYCSHNYPLAYPMTSPCHVIDPVVANEFPSNKIGKNKWQNGCPTGRYIKGVWAALPTEHFQKIKCCEGAATDNSLSWELRDLAFFSGGKSTINEQWNIQCQSNAVITGVRYFTDKRGLRNLSAVRCSALKYQNTDPKQCMVMDFTDQVVSTNMTYNKKWQHECPDDYALVGLYDDNYFGNIKKGKCCKIIDVAFRPGWVSNFEQNLSNLSQSTEDSGDFKIGANSWAQTPNIIPVLPPPKYKLFRLMSPAFNAGKFCLNITYVKFRSPLKIMVKLVTADSVEILNDDDFTFAGKLSQKTEQLFIRTSSTGQVYFDVQGGSGFSYLQKISIGNEKECINAYHECSPVKQNCPVNEVCTVSNGNFRCLCDTNRGFIKDQNGNCIKKIKVSTAKPTDGTGKNGGGGGWATVSRPTIPTKSTTTPNIQGNLISDLNQTSPWTYVAAGGSSIFVLLMIITGIFTAYKRTKVYKRRHRTFESQFSLSPLTAESHTKLTQQCSISSVTFETEGEEGPFYRKYMDSLGYVESATTAAAIASNNAVRFLGTSPDSTCCLDPLSDDPIYQKINRGNTISEDENGNEVNKNIEHQRRGIMRKQPAIQEEDEEMFRLDVDNRRPSTLTLHYPDYGDSDDETDTSGERFLVPGDDEEDLLSELNELTPESVRISQKIIGQGAFGLVKLGELHSTNGSAKVAVKILKQRAGLEITQNDRIKFYQEAHIMSQFDHDNVITLFGVLVGSKPCMVIEHMDRGNLWKYLNMIRRARQKENVNEISRQLHGLFLKMARDIVAGMTYLASLEFVHRDLATRNILLDSKMKCKISDFGLSRHFLKDDHYYKSQGGQIPVKWTAPEALNFQKYSTMSDVWSYGIVLWEIWSLGKRPYEQWDNNRVLKEVCENHYRLSSPDQTPVLIYRIMLDCWKEDKNDRPTFNKIGFCLQHNDDRILGSRKKIKRARSITFSIESEFSETSEDDEELHCRTG